MLDRSGRDSVTGTRLTSFLPNAAFVPSGTLYFLTAEIALASYSRTSTETRKEIRVALRFNADFFSFLFPSDGRHILYSLFLKWMSKFFSARVQGEWKDSRRLPQLHFSTRRTQIPFQRQHASASYPPLNHAPRCHPWALALQVSCGVCCVCASTLFSFHSTTTDFQGSRCGFRAVSRREEEVSPSQAVEDDHHDCPQSRSESRCCGCRRGRGSAKTLPRWLALRRCVSRRRLECGKSGHGRRC